MKRVFYILCALAVLFLFCSCTKEGAHNPNEYNSIKTAISKDSVKDFLDLLKDYAPSGIILGQKIDEKNCYNVTPAEVAAETDMKIFKFSDSFASFVMVDNEIYPICESLGGYGFVSAIPCDFNNDGEKDILVASSCGSGMHSSEISLFNSVTKESTILYDTVTTDTTSTDLIVARSTANIFTDDPEIAEELYYSVLSVKINMDNNNHANLAYVVTGIEGYIECKGNTPQFIPYQN